MRVISQNGLIDVPYELTAFHIVGEDVRMNMAGDTGKGTVMAQYSSQEKACKAMELLREKYIKCNTSPSIKGYGIAAIVAYVRNGVFQFPADDEVEP